MDDDDVYDESLWDMFAVRAPHALRPEIPQQYPPPREEITLLAEEVGKLRTYIADNQPDDPVRVFFLAAGCFITGLTAGFLLRHLLRRNQ